MRKLISGVADINGTTISISPAPSPLPLEINPLFDYATIPINDDVFGLVTITLIIGMLFLSLLSLSFIFHLRVKSRRAHHLHNFNNLWSVRLLFISFVTLWAVNEMPKLPLLRHNYLFPFCPSLTLTQQTNLCKLHVVLSLGFFEPGFLVTLVFLLNLSTKEGNTNNFRQIALVFATILPVFLLQTICVILSPLEAHLPMTMTRSVVLIEDVFGNKVVMCAYPLFSCIVFAAFVIAYLLGLVLSCWRVMSFVINKGIKDRINVLAFTVMVALPLQILLLGVSAISATETSLYGGSLLAIFFSVAVCAMVGEVILVIKPIADAFFAVSDSCRWVVGLVVDPVQ